MKHKILLGFSVAAIGLLFSSAAFADIGTISFYGNNARRPADLVQGCNVPEDQVSGRNYQVVTVSDGLWDNGASCGRRYRMRCISTPVKHSCTASTIDVIVVGRCPNGRCTVGGRDVTMKIAFNRYSLLVQARTAPWANIEYIQI
ncbi:MULTISPECIES: hypothetical protein [Xanthomonas]|uniref:hypothetical protein n=2 Tax=Xanthomonas TaxID=338 RepID=UPI001F34F2E5|nr:MULTISPECIES: hypothetical protein [Xanthomonas]